MKKSIGVNKCNFSIGKENDIILTRQKKKQENQLNYINHQVKKKKTKTKTKAYIRYRGKGKRIYRHQPSIGFYMDILQVGHNLATRAKFTIRIQTNYNTKDTKY